MTHVVDTLRTLCHEIEMIVKMLEQLHPTQTTFEKCESLVQVELFGAVHRLKQAVGFSVDCTEREGIVPARNSTEKGTDVANNAEQNRPSSTEENGPIDANVEDTEVHGTRAIRSKAHQNQSDTERLVSDGPAGIQEHQCKRKDSGCVAETEELKGILTCSTCKKKFVSSACLRKHVKTHKAHAEHVCETCGKSYKTSSHLREHTRIHTGEKPFVCSLCGRAFAQAGARKAHERAHGGANSFHCELCVKTYRSKSSLTVHMRTHTGHRPYACPDCGKGFVRRQGLTVHTRVHSGERPYSCALCGLSFSAAATFRKHSFSHQATTPYQCEDCGKYFTTNTKLKTHAQIHRRTMLVCDTCGGRFKSEALLRNHAAKCKKRKVKPRSGKGRLKQNARNSQLLTPNSTTCERNQRINSEKGS